MILISFLSTAKCPNCDMGVNKFFMELNIQKKATMLNMDASKIIGVDRLFSFSFSRVVYSESACLLKFFLNISQQTKFRILIHS